jgi:DNA ligase-associated metallophosphoesterase
MNPHAVEIAGEAMQLDARRALWWTRQRWLLVADLHLGKASLLRQAGAALPRGTTTHDLARLSALVDDYAPERLLVLGDLVHGAERLDAQWLHTFAQWRERHGGLALTLVGGNHDRHMQVEQFGFEVVDELIAAPFVLMHAPVARAGLHVLAGHVHPGASVRDGRIQQRWPAFWRGPRRTLLPAFGSLCGLSPRAPAADDHAFAATPGGILALGSSASGGSRRG